MILISCLEVDHEGVLWDLFLEPHSENSALLLPFLCGHLSAAHSCAPQPPSHLKLMFCFTVWLVWSRKTWTPHAQSDGGLPSPRGACAALGGHSFMFNYSESISSVPLEIVHDPCFSLARLLCWGGASACWFSVAAKECFPLPLPSQSPQTLSLPRECCFGTRHWISVAGCSVVSAQQVSASFWSQVSGAGQIDRSTCDQCREKLQFLCLLFSSLFCAASVPVLVWETRTLWNVFLESLLCLGSGLLFKKATQPSWLVFSITKQSRGWEDHPPLLLYWQGFLDAVEDGLTDAVRTCQSSHGPRWVAAAHPVKCRAAVGMSRGETDSSSQLGSSSVFDILRSKTVSSLFFTVS